VSIKVTMDIAAKIWLPNESLSGYGLMSKYYENKMDTLDLLRKPKNLTNVMVKDGYLDIAEVWCSINTCLSCHMYKDLG
jgi:hypothetical protein